MKRIITGIVLSLLAHSPVHAWEFYTDGPIEPSIVLGLEHRPGEPVQSNYHGTERLRDTFRDDENISHFGLHGLTAGERSDYPCMVEFDWTQLTGGNPPRDEMGMNGRAFNRCGPRGPVQNSVQNLSVDHGLGSWATGMTVCNTSNGRMKGIRLRGTRYSLDTDTKQIREDGNNTEQFARANCGGNWGTNVSCRSGQIIVGVEVFYMPDRNGRREADSIIGFQLFCRALMVRP